MKIVKYVFLLLLLTAIAVVVFIATQDGKYDIHKERVIKAPKTVLYNYIGDYKNWENAGILTEGDSTAVYSYSENTSGKGASMRWKNNGAEGEINTAKLVEGDSIVQKATIDGLDSEITWSFKDTVGGTKVSVNIKGELSFREKAYAAFRGDVDGKMEAALDKSLHNLNTFLVDELRTYNIDVKGLVTKTGLFYLGQPVTSNIADVQKKAGEILPKLMAFVKTNKITVNGVPFILYKAFDREQGTAQYVVSVPIRDEIHTAPGSEYEGGKLLAFQALKTTLKGDYSHLEKAWDAAQKYIRENSLQENTTGQYVELYTKGMQQTKRPSEWITDIYIPIGAQTIVPETDPMSEMMPVSTSAPAVPKPKAGGTMPAGTKPASKPSGTSHATTGATRPVSKPSQSSTAPTQ